MVADREEASGSPRLEKIEPGVGSLGPRKILSTVQPQNAAFDFRERTAGEPAPPEPPGSVHEVQVRRIRGDDAVHDAAGTQDLHIEGSTVIAPEDRFSPVPLEFGLYEFQKNGFSRVIQEQVLIDHETRCGRSLFSFEATERREEGDGARSARKPRRLQIE
jgi:hypothetical protein